MASATIDPRTAREDLFGTTCRGCGGQKSARMSHCRGCYFSLPREMRSALYRELGSGYEEAYAESLQYLRQRKGGARG